MEQTQPMQHEPQPSVPAQSASVTFVGPIQYPASKNLRNHLCWMVQQGHKDATILFSSWGGSLHEGFALYNFLRALPIRLTMWNIGSVESVANTVFLAADQRFACPQTYFKLHGFEWGFPQPATIDHEKLKEISLSLGTDESRYLSILKERSTATDDEIARFDFFNKGTVIQAGAAKDLGIIHDVKQATMNAENPLAWNIEY